MLGRLSNMPIPIFNLEEEFATGDEISRVVDKLETVLSDEPDPLCIMSLISLAIYYQDPDMDMQKLADLAFDVSKFICRRIIENEAPPVGGMN